MTSPYLPCTSVFSYPSSACRPTPSPLPLTLERPQLRRRHLVFIEHVGPVDPPDPHHLKMGLDREARIADDTRLPHVHPEVVYTAQEEREEQQRVRPDHLHRGHVHVKVDLCRHTAATTGRNDEVSRYIGPRHEVQKTWGCAYDLNLYAQNDAV